MVHIRYSSEPLRLERQLQSELNLAGSCGGSDQLSRRRNGREALIEKLGHGSIGYLEIRMVENVEEFRPELEVKSFADLGVLNQRQVEVANARPDYTVASGIAQPRSLCRWHRGAPRIRSDKTLRLDVVVGIAGVNRILARWRVYAIGHVE